MAKVRYLVKVWGLVSLRNKQNWLAKLMHPASDYPLTSPSSPLLPWQELSPSLLTTKETISFSHWTGLLSLAWQFPVKQKASKPLHTQVCHLFDSWLQQFVSACSFYVPENRIMSLPGESWQQMPKSVKTYFPPKEKSCLNLAGLDTGRWHNTE